MIILDAGHGGADPGASHHGILEKDWTLEVTLYQYHRLRELGIPVLLSRSKDLTLPPKERSAKVRASRASLCISNHFNAGGGSGCEIIHSIYSDAKLAERVASEIKQAGMPVRRVFSKKGINGDYYYMHRLTGNVKTLIIEYGFIDHPEDYQKLNSKRLMYAEAVVKAICLWLEQPYKKKEKEVPSTKSMALYYVQVGAFKNKENAENLVKQLNKDGYPAFVKY